MRWLAKYGGTGGVYYRTVWADSVNEAQKLALRFQKKNSQLISVKGCYV